MLRPIIEIDEKKCTGCGLCVPSCAEGALQIVDGKAKLVSEVYCDGLGACLGECPEGALIIVDREAPEFDEAAVEAFLRGESAAPAAEADAQAEEVVQAEPLPCGCPGSSIRTIRQPERQKSEPVATINVESELSQWPIQLRLIPPHAPFFANADLLVAADCVPFAYPRFHQDFLHGRVLVIGCPKLDDVQGYVNKLAEIVKLNNLKRITVVHMEVPCCFSLVEVVRQAVARSGKKVQVDPVVVTVDGKADDRRGLESGSHV